MFSIIIPMYNVEKYIVACLDSILNQKDISLEVILVDDGSTDNTVNIVVNYINTHVNDSIKLFKQKNSGVSTARNLALSKVNNELIIFMDADDKMKENSLKMMYDKYKIEDADLFSFAFDYFDGTNLIETELSKKNSFLLKENDPLKLIDKYLKNTDYLISWYPWAKIFKKSIIDKFGIKFDKNLICCNDFNFFYNYFLHCNSVGFFNEKVVDYTVLREGSITKSRKLKNIMSDCNSYYDVFSKIKKIDSKNDILKYISNIYVNQLVVWCKYLTKKENKELNNLVRNQNVIFSYNKGLKGNIKKVILSIFGFKFGSKMITGNK